MVLPRLPGECVLMGRLSRLPLVDSTRRTNALADRRKTPSSFMEQPRALLAQGFRPFTSSNVQSRVRWTRNLICCLDPSRSRPRATQTACRDLH